MGAPQSSKELVAFFAMEGKKEGFGRRIRGGRDIARQDLGHVALLINDSDSGFKRPELLQNHICRDADNRHKQQNRRNNVFLRATSPKPERPV